MKVRRTGYRCKLFGTMLLAPMYAMLAAGCGSQSAAGPEGSGDGTDSSTHWLEGCSKDSDCGGGLSCQCGVCTEVCASAKGCQEVRDGALCVPVSCGGAKEFEGSLCSQSCERDAECGEASSCEEGVCLPDDAVAAPGVSLDGGPGAPIEACAGAACGDTCVPCDPTDRTCDLDVGSYACDSEGTCKPAPVKCSPFGDEPQDVPDDCEFLAASSEPECGGRPELCERMVSDGRAHFVECRIESPPAGDDEAEFARRLACVAQWFETLGVTASNVGGARVTAVGTMDQLGSAFSSAGLECTPGCGTGDCDYCTEFDEQQCSQDPFCGSYEGSRIDAERQCLTPSVFAACMPMDASCTGASTTKVDSDGQCWVFGAGCEVKALDDVSTNDVCESDLPTCGGDVPVEEGCEAFEADLSQMACGVAWDGMQCVDEGCSCNPTEAGCGGNGFSPSVGECEARWAGCMVSVPTCDSNRLPIGTANLLHHTQPLEVDEEGNPPPYLDWTPAEWTEPLELPIEPIACPDAEGFDQMDCGYPKGLMITRNGELLFQIDVSLPLRVWSRLDVDVGTPIDFRLTPSEFAVRDRATQQPILLVGVGEPAFNSPRSSWVLPPFEVEVTGAFCKRVPDELDAPDCNWLDVAQYLTITAPLRAPDAPDPQLVDITLEPLRSQEFALAATDGDATYRITYDRGVFAGSEKPLLEQCAAFRPRGDAFSLARVKLVADD